MKSHYEAQIADLQARLDKSERAHQAKKQKAKAQKEQGGTQTSAMDE